jgi:enamine deaminase RidA (YjgF/YER057c/UK114 family)
MSREIYGLGGFADIGGYARAVRIGDHIAVSGTAATKADGTPLSPDVYAQTREAFRRGIEAVEALGGSVGDVIRTRIYLVAGVDWQRAIIAHREIFDDVRPANTTLFISGFPPEGVLVEVEIDAITATSGSDSA